MTAKLFPGQLYQSTTVLRMRFDFTCNLDLTIIFQMPISPCLIAWSLPGELRVEQTQHWEYR